MVRTFVTQSRRASLMASLRVLLPESTGTTLVPSSFIRLTLGCWRRMSSVPMKTSHSSPSTAAAVALAEESYGSLTVLCNNAGANFRVNFDEQTEEQWHIIMETALTGSFLGIKAAVPAMRRAGGGSIINMGSVSTTRAGTNPGYSASKVGMLGLTETAAYSYAKDNIRCNLVSPGHVDTPFIRESNPHSPNTTARMRGSVRGLSQP